MRLTVITCNYFKKYVQREIAKASGVTVYKPFQGWRTTGKKKWYYDENRPWTDAAKAANSPMKRQKPYLLEPISDEDWKIFKGDRTCHIARRTRATAELSWLPVILHHSSGTVNDIVTGAKMPDFCSKAVLCGINLSSGLDGRRMEAASPPRLAPPQLQSAKKWSQRRMRDRRCAGTPHTGSGRGGSTRAFSTQSRFTENQARRSVRARVGVGGRRGEMRLGIGRRYRWNEMSYSTDASQSESTGSTIPEGVLLGLGNPLLDITIYTDTSFLERYGLEANNAIIATDKHQQMFHDMVQNYNPTYIAGGATQNSIRVAQWLLQRHHATTFFGGVGDDNFRHIQEEKAAEVGVKVCYQVHRGKKTGVCGAIITGEDRSLVSELGAAELFEENYLHEARNWSYVEQARLYYIGGFVLPVSPDSVLSIARHCARHHKTLVMNLHATFLAKYFADRSMNLTQYIDYLFGNGEEAAEFSKEAGFDTNDIKEIALKTAALPKANGARPRTVIFTQGKKPTIIAVNGEVKEIPVQPVDPSLIKDTNGCGDAFVGGFLSQLAQNRSLVDSLRCGSYAAKVEVLVGPDKGKHGIVNGIIKERNWVYVEGLNCKYRWVNRTSTNPGAMLKVEKPLLVTSEVSLVDPSDRYNGALSSSSAYN
ncbi:hypothetical protein BaRGS_00012749 [Batillaria attramentaria]|uniref:Adenosine kinase n=1 Tax=Batillaria attramentaria TaxID=370345 RepID=A0ABD0LA08_9CAEN